jgi:hypothetical protein
MQLPGERRAASLHSPETDATTTRCSRQAAAGQFAGDVDYRWFEISPARLSSGDSVPRIA